MSIHPRTSIARSRGWAIAFAVIVLILPVGLVWGLPAPARLPRSAGAVALAGGTPPLVENGVVQTNATGPNGTLNAGTIVSVDYRVNVPSYPSGQTAVIRMPSLVAIFATTTGAWHIYAGASNLTVTGNQSAVSPNNLSNKLAAPTDFNASSNATLESQGFAVMASWPEGSHTLDLEWRWAQTSPTGLTTYGPWSGVSSISPAQMVWVDGNPPASVPSGEVFPLCVGGPIGGRNFSVHFSMTSPFQTYGGPAAVAPGGGRFCWNTTVPAWITPQTVQVHLWEYGSSTFLLLQFDIQVTSGNGSGGSGGGGDPSPVAYYALIVVSVVGIIAVMIFARRRGRPPSAVSGPTGPAGSGPFGPTAALPPRDPGRPTQGKLDPRDRARART